MTWTLHTHLNPDALAAAVAARISVALDDVLALRGHALLALAGGRTSPPVFQRLAAEARDWHQVTILPSDERWVAADHADCNLRQMRAAFAGAEGIDWLPLVPDTPVGEVDATFANANLASHAQPFDVCMLGMGADGHFASLFPGAPTLAQALQLPVGARSRAIGAEGIGQAPIAGKPAPTDSQSAISGPAAIAIVPDPMPAAGPHPRISLTLARLLHSRMLLLVISGADKRAVLERAQAEGDATALPVAALLGAHHPQAEVHWCP